MDRNVTPKFLNLFAYNMKLKYLLGEHHDRLVYYLYKWSHLAFYLGELYDAMRACSAGKEATVAFPSLRRFLWIREMFSMNCYLCGGDCDRRVSDSVATAPDDSRT